MAERGMTTYAEVSRATGIFVTVVSRLAKGETKGIDFDTLLRLCLGLGVTPNTLFVIDERPEEVPTPKRPAEKRLDEILGLNEKSASTPNP